MNIIRRNINKIDRGLHETIEETHKTNKQHTGIKQVEIKLKKWKKY